MSLTLFRNLFSCLLDPGNLTPSNDNNFSKKISQCFFQSLPPIISGFIAIINYPLPFWTGTITIIIIIIFRLIRKKSPVKPTANNLTIKAIPSLL